MALPSLALLLLAYRGIDFGAHWDEDFNKINAVEHSLDSGFTLLPDSYTYPGVNYWLTFVGLTPELARLIKGDDLTPNAFRTALTPVLKSNQFRLRLRKVFAFVVALTPAWVFLAVLAWNRSWLEAACASSLLAVSWEVVYHARWIAPDGILMQFGALTFLLVSVAWKKRSVRVLYAAAISAGLACGSKYPGALLLLPVVSAIWLSTRSWAQKCFDSAAAMILSAGAYLVTTPGTIVQPLAFYASMVEARRIYANGWFGNTVKPGLDHLERLSRYFATQLFSTFAPIALILFAFVAAGIWALFRESWRGALIALLFPVVYLLYFSSQAVMIVRNYLVVVPFLAVFAARGIAWTADKIRQPKWRAGFSTVIAVLLLATAADQIAAAESVAQRHDGERFLRAFGRYAAARSASAFAVSPRLESELRKRGLWTGNLVDQRSGAFWQPVEEYVSYYSETVIPNARSWPANHPGTFAAVFGPRDVNLDYYPGWLGEDRIISLNAGKAREMGLADLKGNQAP